MEFHPLSWITFTPLIGMVLVLATPSRSLTTIRLCSLVATFVPLLLATLVYFSAFRGDTSEYQLVERFDWIRSIRAEYHVGIDGLSLVLVWLTSLLFFLSVTASFFAAGASRAYYALLLLLEASLIGAVVSLDSLLFFVFCELTLLPVCVSIGIWGGERRAQAASRFIVITLAGSMSILGAIVALRLEGGTFSIPTLVDLARSGKLSGVHLADSGALFGAPFTTWCLGSLFLGYGIKFSVAASFLLAPRRFVLPAVAILAALGVAIVQLAQVWRAMP